MNLRKAVFFDRDGVLNVEKNYLYRIEDFEWIPGAREAISHLCHDGWLVFVVTNQSGVARGYYTEEDVKKLHKFMNRELVPYDASITEFFYCPHLKGAPVKAYDRDCECRKPKPGMILEAMKKYPLDKDQCFLIGDGKRDVEAAEAAGIRGFLYEGGNLLDFVNRCREEMSHREQPD